MTSTLCHLYHHHSRQAPAFTRSWKSKECQGRLPHQREPSANPHVILLRRTKHAAAPATHLSLIYHPNLPPYPSSSINNSTRQPLTPSVAYPDISVASSQQLHTFTHRHLIQWQEARARALEARLLARRTPAQSHRSRTAQRLACK